MPEVPQTILPIIPLIVGQQMNCFCLPLPHPPYPYEAPLCRVLSLGYVMETGRSLITLCHIVQQPRAQTSPSSQQGVCEVIHFPVTDESCQRPWSASATKFSAVYLYLCYAETCLAGKVVEGWRQVW